MVPLGTRYLLAAPTPVPNGSCSRRPPLSAPVALEVAERTLTGLAHAQVELLDVRIGEHRLARPVLHDGSVLHHVAACRDRERHGRVLLDEHDARPRLVDLHDEI